MKSIHRALARTAWLLGLGLLAGCGRAAPEPAAPGSETLAAPPVPAAAPDDQLAAESGAEPEPQTLAEAEALLEKSRAELERLALYAPPPAGAAAPQSAAAPKATNLSPQRAEQKRAERDATAEETSAASPRDKDAGGGCDTACKAFSSLERASDAVCRLDGSGGQRCDRARRIRDDARQRVASCGCTK